MGGGIEMNDADADVIIYLPKQQKKIVQIFPDNQYFNALKQSYPNSYEETCDCLIFDYSVWKSIQVD